MVPEVFFALGVGVVSGLFSTILVFLGAKYWNSVVIPWYEERVYKDIRIAGEWRTRGKESGEEFSETAIIKQNAHRVWGEITYRTEDEFILYEFEGELRNLILSARYWVKGQNNLDRGTFTLMVKDNGDTLQGYYAWYMDIANEVIGDRYVWTRL